MSLVEPEDPKPVKFLTDLELADVLEQLAAKASSSEVEQFIQSLVGHLRERVKSPFEVARPTFCSYRHRCQNVFFGRCPYCAVVLCKDHMVEHLGEHGFFQRGA